jgi:hypothetical protein
LASERKPFLQALAYFCVPLHPPTTFSATRDEFAILLDSTDKGNMASFG